jgi:drug/metabolite transporter (DMT)-like permease
VRADLSIGRGDLLCLVGALFWALHLQVVGWLARRSDPVRIACGQFVVCAVLSLAAAAAFETVVWSALRAAAWPILYTGLLSVGVAYTLQAVAQRRVPPAHAAIILSLETVFALLGGWLVLGETLPPRGLIGCGLMLAGMIVSQLAPLHGRRRGRPGPTAGF